MRLTATRFCLALIFVSCCSLAAEPVIEPTTGPVIEGFGPVFSVPADSLNLEADKPYKIVMDIGKGPDDPSELNRSIETAARFLNMHARNGIKPENLQLAIVLHGSATRNALNQQAHMEHFKTDNGSKDLVEALSAAGVEIYVCGQSAGYYGYRAEHLLSGLNMSVSAMTAHVRLQSEGYQAILF
jgi:intracellular sulfur oxidation DsrE/DsrF family protein